MNVCSASYKLDTCLFLCISFFFIYPVFRCNLYIVTRLHYFQNFFLDYISCMPFLSCPYSNLYMYYMLYNVQVFLLVNLSLVYMYISFSLAQPMYYALFQTRFVALAFSTYF